jgi:transposase
MTLGLAERQGRLGNVAVQRCEAELPERSIYRLLYAERDRLFGDELFADLYVHHGRRSVPPSILAVVMVLQRLEGCSDREACDRFTYDLRWRYAAGVDDEHPGFVHTVLVELRARLRASSDPDRVFRVTTELARQAGLVGVRRVLDSAPLYDAVATQDTVTLLRGAIRGLLRVAPAELASLVRGALQRDDDYVAAGKPVCDWDDQAAREQLVDELFRDGYRALHALRGARLGPQVAQAAELLATVIGQDIQETADGRFVIAQGVAPDRVISVVDPQARHGHKSNARGFDGYKGHVAIDPDSEVITAAEVGAANAGDAAMAKVLLADLPSASAPPAADPAADAAPPDQPAPVVYGDSAYGTGALLAELAQRGITAMTKVAAPTAPQGHFTKQQFRIDLDQGTVTCPARLTVPILPARGGGGLARFGRACQVCPLAAACTSSTTGRTITIHPHQARLQAARARQRDPGWRADYRAHRPRVERKLAHLLRRRHGGRRARVRGRLRIGQDWRLLAAAVNLARFAVLGVRSRPDGWAIAPA